MLSDIGLEFWVVLCGAGSWTWWFLWVPSHMVYSLVLPETFWFKEVNCWNISVFTHSQHFRGLKKTRSFLVFMCLFCLKKTNLHLSAFAVAFTFLENIISTFRKGNSWEAFLSLCSSAVISSLRLSICLLHTLELLPLLSFFFFYFIIYYYIYYILYILYILLYLLFIIILLYYFNYLNFTTYFRIEFGEAK